MIKLKSAISTLIKLCFVGCIAVILLTPYNISNLKRSQCADEEFFPMSNPAEKGMSEEILNELAGYINTNHPGISGVIAIKDNCCIYEEYFNGNNVDSVFEINSVTKTVIGSLVGCAIDRGLIEDENVPFSQLAGVDQCSEEFGRITVKDMLTMSSGIDWDSVRTSLSIRFDVIKYGTANYFELMKNFPCISEPGTTFRYDSYESRSTMAALTKLVGKEDYEILSDYLFDELGIESFAWPINETKFMPGGQDLYLCLRQLAKYGNLYANGGRYYDKQLISEEWVEKSLSVQTTAESEDRYPADVIGYGFYWWCINSEEYEIRFAFGAGGEYIFVVPEENLCVVISSIDKLKGEDYRDILLDFFIPAITEGDEVAKQ